MKCLVVGGAGFIGSHLVEHLLSQGYEVEVLDNLIAGNPDNVSIPVATSVEDLQSEFWDVIFWLADRVGVKTIVQTKTFNLISSLFLLKTFIGCSHRIVLASSSEVYGQYWSKYQFSYHKRFTYAWIKLLEEFLVSESWTSYVIARLFNVYGPRQRIHAGVVPYFCYRAYHHLPLTLHEESGYCAVRSFLYVKNLAELLTTLAISNWTGIMDIGNPFAVISIRSLAMKIRELFDSKSAILTVDNPYAGPRVRYSSCMEMRRFFGEDYLRQKLVPLEEGLKETANWYRKVFDQNDSQLQQLMK